MPPRTTVFKPPSLTEEQVQQSITNHLRAKRFIVLSTVHRLKICECPECGHRFRPEGDYGADKGVPDLIVRPTLSRSKQWAPTLWMGLEVKGPKTEISPEQKDLAKQGAIVIARTLNEALQGVDAVDESHS